MNKDKKIIAEDAIELFNYIKERHEFEDFDILASYNVLYNIINYAIREEDYDLVFAEFEPEDLTGYNKGFITSFTDDGEIWISRAYNGNNYIMGDEDNFYVEDIYADDYAKDNDIDFFVFGFDEDEEDNDNTCMCIDDDDKGFKLCIHEDDGREIKFRYRSDHKLSIDEMNKILSDNGF